MKTSVLLLISLFALRLWGILPIPGFLLIVIFILLSWKSVFKESLFRWPIVLLIFFIVINSVSSTYLRNQSFVDSFKQASPYMMIISYFFYMGKRIRVNQLEELLFCLLMIFDVGYLVQFLLYPNVVIFPGAAVKYLGDVRIRIDGQCICSLGYFFCISKFLLDERKKNYLLWAALSFFVIFLWGFRSILAVNILFTLFMVYKSKGLGKLFYWGIFVSIVLAILMFLPIVQDKIGSMMQRQARGDTITNSDYIRVIVFDYFMNDHFKSSLEYFLGSGLPDGHSVYSRDIRYMEEHGRNWNDWGLLGLSWLLGVPAILTMVYYSLKAGIVKINKDYYYVKYWFIFMLCTSLFSAEFIRTGSFIIQGIALAIVNKAYNENRHIDISQN